MLLIKLTHANRDTTMYVARALIAGFYYSDAHKCTHVVASGGAVFPAKQSVDEITRLMEEAQESANKGPIGGASS